MGQRGGCILRNRRVARSAVFPVAARADSWKRAHTQVTVKPLAILLLALAVALGVLALRQRNSAPAPAPPRLVVLCDPALRIPVTSIAEQYRREFGGDLLLEFAPDKTYDLAITLTAGPVVTHPFTLVQEILPLAATASVTTADVSAAAPLHTTATNALAATTNAPASVAPATTNHVTHASAIIMGTCTQPAAALRFARYAGAPEKGGAILRQHGFPEILGDRWAEKPELILYSGGVNRPAIEKLLKQFADREGINITTVFNGCGVLCATMKAMNNSPNGRFPDAYYACDLCFVPPVAAQFPEAVLLTETDIGIAVKKGNPRAVKTLADLAQAGLKVGLCNAEQSTLGYMTRGMLKSSGLLESVRKNVSVEVPTADFLINQMRLGALDAAVVYRVNAIPQSEHLDFLPIQHAGAKAIQPFAVRERSPNRQLARRLLAFLKANQREFEQAGFLWRGNEKPIQSKDIQVPPWLKP